MQVPVHGPWEEMDFFKKMEEMSNIHMDFILVPQQAVNERKSLAFASNDLPDVFLKVGLTPQEEVLYGEQGLLKPIEKLLPNYAPNLTKLMKENPIIRKTITQPGGHIYSMPYINEIPRDMTGKIWFNKKWADKLGIPVPQSTEDLYKALKAFKQKDFNGNLKADEVPLSFAGLVHFNYLLGSWGILRDNTDVFVNDNKKVVYVPSEEGYKEALKFYNKLYSEKLLDNESFTLTVQQQKAKGSGNEEMLGAFMSAGAFLIVGEARNSDYVVLPALKGPKGDRMWIKFNTINRGPFAITKVNKYPEATIRWMDWLYSEEGGFMARMGVENINWKMNSNGTWERIIAQGMDVSSAQGKSTPFPGLNAFPMYTPVSMVLKEKEAKPLSGIINRETEKLMPYLRQVYPPVYLLENDQKRIASLLADLKPYVDQMMVKFISGDAKIDSEWDNYVNTLKKMGVEEYVKLYQQAYDIYLKQ